MSPDLTDALQVLLAETDDTLRAMARNLLHDHRIPDERRNVVETLIARPPTPDAIKQAVSAYHAEHVRYTKIPHFVEDRFNRANILAGREQGDHVTSKDFPLGRVLNLSKLTKFYRWARSRDIPLFETVPDGNDERIAAWLDERLNAADRDAFIEAILASLALYQAEWPFEPCWATTWQVLETVASASPNRWNELTGVAPLPDQWLILLRYPVQRTGTLVRPTQLDAGWYCYHFPSPPSASLQIGGHPMDLCGDAASAQLVSEFIHQQVRHDLSHWTDAGARIGKTTELASLPLREHRERHRSLLIAEYGTAVQNWMKDVC